MCCLYLDIKVVVVFLNGSKILTSQSNYYSKQIVKRHRNNNVYERQNGHRTVIRNKII